MAVDLTLYAKIKDRYCLVYLGSCEEYLVQLKLLRPMLEAKFPGIEIYLCYRDSFTEIDNEPKTLKFSKLKEMQNMFAYVREITYNEHRHPVEQILQECQIHNYQIETPTKDQTTLCSIYPNGTYPTKSLTTDEVKKLCKLAKNSGYNVDVNLPLGGVGKVIGVENKELFKAAAMGIDTTLVSTGLGSNLFKTMFPRNKILLPAHI